jgi:hypothetical protein
LSTDKSALGLRRKIFVLEKFRDNQGAILAAHSI